MAAELTLQIMGDSALGPRAGGWLRATLYWQGMPYWPGAVPEGTPGFDWTWIDLLAWLTEHWSALMLEESAPLPLAGVADPADWPRKVEERWQDLPDERVDAEEARWRPFMERHNLAWAFHGAYLPMLGWLRSGQTVWLVSEDDQARRVDFPAARQALERIGEQLAEAFATSPRPALQAILRDWRQREDQLRRDYLSYRTGLSAARLTRLHERLTLEVPAVDDLLALPEAPALAVARMSRFVLATEPLAVVMERLQRAAPARQAIFPDLSPAAQQVLAGCAGQPAWAQGYALASWLRQRLGGPLSAPVDPERLLRDAGVTIEEWRLDTPDLDAMACWGPVQPLILLNRHPRARGAHRHGRRTTLAHELGHLLVDRERALPVAEVLGGEVDREAEQRANAFAAEWLLPRAWAVEALRQAPDLDQALHTLSRSHGVSLQLAARQILNAQPGLTEDEQIRLERYAESR